MPALLHTLDLQGFRLFNAQWRTELFDDLALMLSRDPLFWGMVVGALATYMVMRGRSGLRRLPLPLLFLLLSLGTSDLAATGAKNMVDRPRPHNVLPGVHYFSDGQWRATPEDFIPKRHGGSSFYSGHATNSMAVAAMFASVVPQASPWVYLLPVSVGWSRLYLGKHYPFDVLCGWLAGLLIGKFYGKLYRLTAASLRRRIRRARNGGAPPQADEGPTVP